MVDLLMRPGPGEPRPARSATCVHAPANTSANGSRSLGRCREPAGSRLHISFTFPADLVPGYYDFLHCNDACTTGFGELIAGVIQVGDPPSRLIDGQVVHYQRADLTYPPVAELATTATAPAELAATRWSAQGLLVGVLLVTIGTSATTAARRQARGTP